MTLVQVNGPLIQQAMEGIIAALKGGRADPLAIPRFDLVAQELGRAADRGDVDRKYAQELLADYDTVSGGDAAGDNRRDHMLIDRYKRIEGLMALDQLAVDAEQGGGQPGGTPPRAINPDGSPREGVAFGNTGWRPGGARAVAGLPPEAPQAPASVTATLPSSQAASGADFPGIAAAYGTPPVANTPGAVLGTYVGDAFRQMVGGVAAAGKDIAGGVIEGPMQAVGGARDAAQAWRDFAEWAGDNLQNLMPIGEIDTSKDQLPNIPDPTHPPRTVTGALVRTGVQWLTSFKGVDKIMPIIREAKDAGGMAKVAGEIAQGGLAGFLGFSPEQGRLSDLFVEKFPQAKNPVTDWLKSDPGDAEALARFKTALETMGFGVATDGILALLKAGRVAEGAPQAGATDTSAAAGAGERDVISVASPDRPAAGSSQDIAAQKLQAAGTELDQGGRGDTLIDKVGNGKLTALSTRGDVFADFGALLTRLTGGENASDVIEGIIHDTAKAMRPEIDAARRGKKTHAETVDAAGNVDAFAVLLQRRKGAPLNAEETVAAGALWKGAAEKLQELSRTAAQDPSPQNLFAARQMMAVFYAIQKEVIGARAETGRALDAWKLVGKGDQMQQLQAILNAEGGLDTNLALIQKLAGINDLSVLSDTVDKGFYAKTRDTVQEVFFGNILSGPKTHLVNMIGNATIAALHVAETAISSRIGRMIGSDGAAVGEAMANVSGMLNGVKDAFRAAARTWQSGQSAYGGLGKFAKDRGDAPAISSTTWNVRSDSFAGMAIDAIGAVIRAPGRALMTEDEWFKTVVERGSLWQQAFRQAQREIADGTLATADAKARIAALVENPSPAMRDTAIDQAHYQTLTSPPGALTQKLNSLRADYPMTRFIIPFLQVPANVFKMVGEHTPLAPLMDRYKTAIASGGAEADLARTKMAVGTSLTMIGLDAALDGKITGSGPPPGSQRQEWLRAGNQPYSLKVGDRWFAYNRVEPIGSLLGYAADLGEWLVNNPAADDADIPFFDGAFGAAIFSAAENATSKTYLKGFADLVEAMAEPDRFAQRYIENFAGALLVPRIVTEASQAADPTMRATDGFFDELKSRSPFSQSLQPVRDLWGRPVDYRSGLGVAFDALSPIYSSKYEPEPVDKAMEADGFFIGMPAKGFQLDGGNVKLSNAQYSEYLGLRGQTKASDLPAIGTARSPVALAKKYGDVTLLQAENALVAGAKFTAMKPEEREKAIRAIAGDYQDAAKALMLQKYPQLVDQAAKQKAARYKVTPAAP
jgi:hypothetical protein